MQVTAKNRRNCRCNGENHHHVRHRLLRQRPFIAVADNRARNDHADAAREALHQARADQHFNRWREGADDSGGGVDRERRQHHRAPPDGIRNRAVPQAHHGKAGEVGRERLLRLQ